MKLIDYDHIIIFQITQLKIDHNPFAKGFRDNFDRTTVSNTPSYYARPGLPAQGYMHPTMNAPNNPALLSQRNHHPASMPYNVMGMNQMKNYQGSLQHQGSYPYAASPVMAYNETQRSQTIRSPQEGVNTNTISGIPSYKISPPPLKRTPVADVNGTLVVSPKEERLSDNSDYSPEVNRSWEEHNNSIGSHNQSTGEDTLYQPETKRRKLTESPTNGSPEQTVPGPNVESPSAGSQPQVHAYHHAVLPGSMIQHPVHGNYSGYYSNHGSSYQNTVQTQEQLTSFS